MRIGMPARGHNLAAFFFFFFFIIYKIQIVFHFELLYLVCNNSFFCQETPPLLYKQYIARYDLLLHSSAPPSVEVIFEVSWRFFVCLVFRVRGRIRRCQEMLKKMHSRHRKGALLSTLWCNTSLPPPLYCLQYCAAYISPP